MKIMNLKERKEDAVSPVIGVMLMLVVTIVIAAVVAAFAGGLATETESAPVAVLDADVYEGANLLVGKKSYAVSFILQDENKTLTDVQIDAIMNKLIKNFDEKLDAKIR